MRRLVSLALLGFTVTAAAEERVARARATQAAGIAALFRAAAVSYPPGEIYLRAFKEDRELELWAGERGKALVHVTTYRICAPSGTLGPKRQQGDGQVPEGFYRIVRFNPQSRFHLSLGLDYPNASDQILGHRGRLGGDIFIHGSCVTIGCLPIEDGPIEQLYVIALDTRAGGQARIPVHVFPRRMDAQGIASLESRGDAALNRFWRSLQPGYTHCERTRRPPVPRVDGRTGLYRFAP